MFIFYIDIDVTPNNEINPATTKFTTYEISYKSVIATSIYTVPQVSNVNIFTLCVLLQSQRD